MRIAVVADTHLPRFGRALPPPLDAALRAAAPDLILHCGDWTAEFAVALLEAIAPVEAVAGNNDGPELQARFGRRRIVAVAGRRIGLVHGDLGPGGSSPERAGRAFGADEVDIVCFGHSHVPTLERLADGRLLVNPGSPTDRRRQPNPTWALLTLGTEVSATIEPLPRATVR